MMWTEKLRNEDRQNNKIQIRARMEMMEFEAGWLSVIQNLQNDIINLREDCS